MTGKIWVCKVGEDMPKGSGPDAPMRKAIAKAYEEVTGVPPAFIFSGWGGKLTECERAVVENREPVEPFDEDEHSNEMDRLRAELAELRAQVPVAYMHNKRADVIHTSVKSLLSDFAVNYGPESMLRPIDKSEHYTIPLYAAPVPAQPAADVAAIAKAVRDIPSRIESLGGQRFAYVKLSEVIDTIYSMAGKHPAVPDDVAKDALALAYGYLWHVNNMRPGYDAPSGYSRPQLTPEKAAYKARGILRGLLTNEQRGEGINRADAAILATDKEGKERERRN